MVNEPPHVVARFLLRPFKRVGAEVEQSRQSKRHHRLHPYIQPVSLLFHEHRLPLLVIVGPVEEFTPLVGAFVGEKLALVIAVEMHLEGLTGGFVPL